MKIVFVVDTYSHSLYQSKLYHKTREIIRYSIIYGNTLPPQFPGLHDVLLVVHRSMFK